MLSFLILKWTDNPSILEDPCPLIEAGNGMIVSDLKRLYFIDFFVVFGKHGSGIANIECIYFVRSDENNESSGSTELCLFNSIMKDIEIGLFQDLLDDVLNG